MGLPTLDEEEEAEMRDEPILISDLPTTIKFKIKLLFFINFKIVHKIQIPDH